MNSALQLERQAAYEAALAKLKGKQRAFVEAYVGEAKFVGKAAAIAAGYSEKTAVVKASQLLTIVNVFEAIEAAFALRAMPADEVLLRLSQQAAGSIADFIDVVDGVEEANIDTDDNGRETVVVKRVWGLNLDKAEKAGALPLVKKLKATKYGTEVELYDSQAALQLLGKHHKLWGDDGGILKFLDLSKLSDAQLLRINQGEDPIAVLLDKQPDPA